MQRMLAYGSGGGGGGGSDGSGWVALSPKRSNAVSSVLKQRTNTTACAAQGKSLVFLLAASTGELDALREQAQLAGEAAAAHGSAKRTSKKRRQKKVAADLRSNCVAWLDQKDDLGACALELCHQNLGSVCFTRKKAQGAEAEERGECAPSDYANWKVLLPPRGPHGASGTPQATVAHQSMRIPHQSMRRMTFSF